jgi:erythromycin esterase-like protein
MTPTPAALGDFERFPAWMWRNHDFVDFVGWLRGHNDAVANASRKVRLYGLDLYSLRSSMDAVIAYRARVGTSRRAANRARRHFAT